MTISYTDRTNDRHAKNNNKLTCSTPSITISLTRTELGDPTKPHQLATVSMPSRNNPARDSDELESTPLLILYSRRANYYMRISVSCALTALSDDFGDMPLATSEWVQYSMSNEQLPSVPEAPTSREWARAKHMLAFLLLGNWKKLFSRFGDGKHMRFLRGRKNTIPLRKISKTANLARFRGVEEIAL